ncbi:hypothetical protein ACIQWL_08990 [Streptomyces mirabilis]|uniref:hypothetical protein n=1 Tax=Streptomyces mirabilis TaxID=68239 RepID=UPI00381D7829
MSKFRLWAWLAALTGHVGVGGQKQASGGGRVCGEARLCRMGEWVTAVIGLLGAGVGAAAAMWGANRAARVSQEALAVQIRKEDEHWMRDQRQAAYHALIRADTMQQEAAIALQGQRGEDGDVSAELREVEDAAHREMFAALSLIELCGPQPVLEAARELKEAGSRMVMIFSWRSESARSKRHDTYERQRVALDAFRSAAREALGYGSDFRVPRQLGRPEGTPSPE